MAIVKILVTTLFILLASNLPSSRGVISRKPRTAASRQGKVHQVSVVYYNTPITPTSFSSPVIIVQTALGRNKANFPNALYTCFTITHQILSAPVYHTFYSIYGSYLEIPSGRALRIRVEQQDLLTAKNNRYCTTCFKKGESTPRAILNTHTEKSLVNLTARLIYEDGEILEYFNPESISLKVQAAGESLRVEIFATYVDAFKGYNDCTVVYTHVNATMVNMYDTNPYITAGVSKNLAWKLLLLVSLFTIIMMDLCSSL